MILTKRLNETREVEVVLATVNRGTKYEIFAERWITISLAKNEYPDLNGDCFAHISFYNFVNDILCPWNFIMVDIPTQLTQLNTSVTSSLPSQENLSSFSSGPLFFALCFCRWLFLSGLASVSSNSTNSMKSPIRMPHSKPWQNSSEGFIFAEGGYKAMDRNRPHGDSETNLLDVAI